MGPNNFSGPLPSELDIHSADEKWLGSDLEKNSSFVLRLASDTELIGRIRDSIECTHYIETQIAAILLRFLGNNNLNGTLPTEKSHSLVNM
ncbi:hypothetical protein Pint_06987 [Pistacia integerrima]|uniref:Uncharacterized protein n=1 Tax=Pistacia integerrima TaxID=434235 RepID=A0ACC0XTY7_9ROSI|nr:hypothetical protein Pint_06987 [Pistacia integerrima]